MGTNLGFFLLFLVGFALWDLYKTWAYLFSKGWTTTVRQNYEEAQRKMERQWWKSCIFLPFQLMMSYGYLFLCIPYLTVWGLQNDNKLYASVVLLSAVFLLVRNISVLARSARLTVQYTQAIKALESDSAGATTVTLIDANSGLSLADMPVLSGGLPMQLAIVSASTLVDMYVLYLFAQVVLLV